MLKFGRALKSIHYCKTAYSFSRRGFFFFFFAFPSPNPMQFTVSWTSKSILPWGRLHCFLSSVQQDKVLCKRGESPQARIKPTWWIQHKLGAWFCFPWIQFSGTWISPCLASRLWMSSEKKENVVVTCQHLGKEAASISYSADFFICWLQKNCYCSRSEKSCQALSV